MWKYSSKDFVITDKKRGLSLYNSISGPTNIRKDALIAKKREFDRIFAEAEGGRQEYRRAGVVSGEVDHTNSKEFWSNNGFEVLAASQVPSVHNFSDKKGDSSGFRRTKNVKFHSDGKRSAGEIVRNENFGEKSVKRSSVQSSERKMSNSRPSAVSKKFHFRKNNEISEDKSIRSDLSDEVNNLIIFTFAYITFVSLIRRKSRRMSNILLTRLNILRAEEIGIQIISSAKRLQHPKNLLLLLDLHRMVFQALTDHLRTLAVLALHITILLEVFFFFVILRLFF